jgi:hypothetical protein
MDGSKMAVLREAVDQELKGISDEELRHLAPLMIQCLLDLVQERRIREIASDVVRSRRSQQ